MIDLPSQPPDGALWSTLIHMADALEGAWVLIGARMVELHARRHRRTPPRRSADGDVLCRSKLAGERPADVAAWLREQGFALAGFTPEGIGHRYQLDSIQIDVLAPDHLGPRADTSVEPGVRTVTVPGGSRALAHATQLEVRCGTTIGSIAVPTLLGALVAKSRAVAVDDAPTNQRIDLAFLYSLVDEATSVRMDASTADVKVLRSRTELSDRDHEAWMEIGDDADRGHAAFRLLTR